MNSKNTNFDPRILLAIVPIIWGINFTVMKIGLQNLDPIPYNTSRLLVATAISWLLVVAFKAYSKIELKDFRAIIMISLFGFALPQIGITMGIKLTTAGNCSLIMALLPISVVIINRFIGVAINKMITRGILISFTGVTLVILGSNSGFSLASGDLSGILVMLVAQFLCAYFTVYSKPLVEKYSPYLVIAITMTVSLLVFVLLSFNSLLNTNWSVLPGSAWFSIFYSGILALAVANFIWIFAVKTIGSTKTAVFSNLTPVFALITGSIVLHETFSLFQFLGAAVILTGLIMTQKGQKATQKHTCCKDGVVCKPNVLTDRC